jgi:hypothetical protein
MDLVALLNEDGALSVHRTISWDKILAKSVELVDDEWGVPTSVAFSPSGTLLALGHSRGQISIVNLESGEVTKAYDSSSIRAEATALGSDGKEEAITKIMWMDAPPRNSSTCSSRSSSGSTTAAAAGYSEEARLAVVSGIGGMYQGLKASAVNASDVSLDTAPAFSLSDSAMPGSMLYAIGAAGTVIAYVSGVFPLFVLQGGGGGGGHITAAMASNDVAARLVASWYTFSTNTNNDLSVLGNEKLLFGPGPYSIGTLLSRHYDEHAILLLLRAKANAAGLATLVSTCAKRWKDANRPLSMKMGLMKGALEGYVLYCVCLLCSLVSSFPFLSVCDVPVSPLSIYFCLPVFSEST